MNPYRGLMRGNSLPVTLVELLFLLLAMARGFSPTAAFASLPQLTKVGSLLFLAVTTSTTIAVAVSSLVAVLGMFKLFAHFMFGLAFAHQIANWTSRQRRYIWLAIGLGVVGYCILWGINIAFYNPVGDDWVWLVPTLTNIRWVGFFALAIFCAGIGSLPPACRARDNLQSLLFALFFSTGGLTIAFWTGSRGPILAIISAAILSSLLGPARKQIIILSLSATFLALLFSVSLPVVHPAYGIDRIIGSSMPTNGMAGLSSRRTETWIATIKKIKQRPAIGWGIDQFRFAGSETELKFRHPHQGLLQLLFSTGCLGLLATLLIVMPFADRFPRKMPHPYQWGAIAYSSGAVIYGLYDGFFYYTYPMMIFLIAVVCLAAPIPLSETYKSD